jgi:SAM-dependent methyltransferase
MVNSKNLDYVRSRLANWLLKGMRRKVAGDDPFHWTFVNFREMVLATDNPAVLEIGSRNVSTGQKGCDRFPGVTDYTGVDIHPGQYVDVVADAHQLGRAFPTRRFDFVYSLPVFEHLMFPWKVVLEINEILKPGGHVFVSTHPRMANA